jgi:hypothetical protein
MRYIRGTRRRIAIGVAGLVVVATVAFVAWDYRVGSYTGPLALYDGVPSGDDADLNGILTREGDCLYVDWEDPGDGDQVRDVRVLVAFADSVTSWDEPRQTVRFGGRKFGVGSLAYHFGSDTLRVGEAVSLGGGGHSGDDPRWETDWVEPPDASCDVTGIWIAG